MMDNINRSYLFAGLHLVLIVPAGLLGYYIGKYWDTSGTVLFLIMTTVFGVIYLRWVREMT